MTTPTAIRTSSRKRLSSNHNETIVVDRTKQERKRLSSNHNETIVVDAG